MKIETKYQIGNKIRFKKELEDEEKIVCPFCNGRGRKKIHGKSVSCNNCEAGVIKHKKPGEISEFVGKIKRRIFEEIEPGEVIVMYEVEYARGFYSWEVFDSYGENRYVKEDEIIGLA